MLYMTVSEASEKWGVSVRQAQRLLAQSRVEGAQKFGRVWLIPADAHKPALPRREKPPVKPLCADLDDVITSSILPLPDHNPDAILHSLAEERIRLQYAGELAYLRGDFKQTLRCFSKTLGEDAARLRACPSAIAAAISTGDYHAYTEIEGYLRSCINAHQGSPIAAMAELGLAAAAVGVFAPNMVPPWLREGDFEALPCGMKPFGLYLRAKYFLCVGRYESMLAVSETALVLCEPERGITPMGIYLRLCCAIACYRLDQQDKAVLYLQKAMELALPHGFITPFAEVITSLGGLVEQGIIQAFPACYDAVLGQWKRTWKNWATFHNQFTKDNITLILSLREYHLALLVARRVPYAQIARQHCISVGRLKNIMLEIYGKLFVSGRDELAKYIL